MLKALKRIIAWTGPYRRNLYLGCVCSFFMTWATAPLPWMTLGMPGYFTAFDFMITCPKKNGCSTARPVVRRFALRHALHRFWKACG